MELDVLQIKNVDLFLCMQEVNAVFSDFLTLLMLDSPGRCQTSVLDVALSLSFLGISTPSYHKINWRVCVCRPSLVLSLELGDPLLFQLWLAFCQLNTDLGISHYWKNTD
jgi:hypothetical protein